MLISKNVAKILQRYKDAKGLSLLELSEELGVARTILVEYLHGEGNPRADTLELLAEHCGVPVTTMVSGLPPGWEQAETIMLAAKELSTLPPERRERAAKLFLALADIFAEEEQT